MGKTKMDKELKKQIKLFDNIVIAKHTYPDWDAQGSAMGLAYIIRENFKNKHIYVVGDRLNQDTEFSGEKLTDDILANSLLITVDTANTERIDFKDWRKAKVVFKVDHHLEVEKYGDYNLVEPNTIACTQVITLWAKRMHLKINRNAAKNLYKGLVTDSGRFLFHNVDENTFKAAAILMEAGVNLDEVQNEVYLSKLAVRKFQNNAFAKMQMNDKGVAWITIEPKDYSGLDLTRDEIKSALGTMAGIEEIKIWAAIIEIDGEIKVSLRSRDYDINSVAVKFNGGGHRLASGAKLQSFDETDKLIKELTKLIK